MTAQRSSADANHAAYPGAPRWVKAFGIVAILVLLLVILRLTVFGGHEHGPGRHFRAPDASAEATSSAEHSTPSSGDAGDHTPPHGGH